MIRHKGFPPTSRVSKITPEVLDYAQCSKPTLISWLRSFRIITTTNEFGEEDGEIHSWPVGVRVGGRWIINLDLLDLLLRGEGELDYPMGIEDNIHPDAESIRREK
jgi:hypothetical protein